MVAHFREEPEEPSMIGRFLSVLLAALLAAALPAAAQQEFPPPSGGKARVVIVAAGASGQAAYRDVSGRIAALGDDVFLYDAKSLAPGDTLRATIAQALQMPHALPGKVGLVGFSLGGGAVLGYGASAADQVAVVAAWYPSTRGFNDLDAFAGRLTVPVVMFAGEDDTYNHCCVIDKARAIARAAQARGASFELTTYPNTQHHFIVGSPTYKAQAFADAFARTDAALKRYLAN